MKHSIPKSFVHLPLVVLFFLLTFSYVSASEMTHGEQIQKHQECFERTSTYIAPNIDRFEQLGKCLDEAKYEEFVKECPRSEGTLAEYWQCSEELAIAKGDVTFCLFGAPFLKDYLRAESCIKNYSKNSQDYTACDYTKGYQRENCMRGVLSESIYSDIYESRDLNQCEEIEDTGWREFCKESVRFVQIENYRKCYPIGSTWRNKDVYEQCIDETKHQILIDSCPEGSSIRDCAEREAIKKKDVRYCFLVWTHDSYEHASCVEKYAIHFQDIKSCDFIGRFDDPNNCRMRVIAASGYVGLCGEVVDDDQQKVCYEIMESGDEKLLQCIEDNSTRSGAVNTCYNRLAIETGDSAYCRSANEIEYCFSNVVGKFGYENVDCEVLRGLEYEEYHSLCLLRQTPYVSDADHCGNINGSIRYLGHSINAKKICEAQFSAFLNANAVLVWYLLLVVLLASILRIALVKLFAVDKGISNWLSGLSLFWAGVLMPGWWLDHGYSVLFVWSDQNPLVSYLRFVNFVYGDVALLLFPYSLMNLYWPSNNFYSTSLIGLFLISLTVLTVLRIKKSYPSDYKKRVGKVLLIYFVIYTILSLATLYLYLHTLTI